MPPVPAPGTSKVSKVAFENIDLHLLLGVGNAVMRLCRVGYSS
jgi:hypothetical protein